jgi:hypothetical protein
MPSPAGLQNIWLSQWTMSGPINEHREGGQCLPFR